MADIFDRMLDGINRGVNSIATGSKNIMEKSRINGEIDGLENEKNNIIGQIGCKAYELYTDGKLTDFEELEKLCTLVKSKNEEIAAKQRELEMVIYAAQYRAQPQSPYQPPQEQHDDSPKFEDETLSYCHNCGTHNPTGAAFCANCGSRLE